MLFITSPTKTLDVGPNWNTDLDPTKPEFEANADLLATKLAKLSKKQLQKFLKVSEKLTLENYERFQNWFEVSGKPAILTYSGDVYKQFSALSFTKLQQQYIQSHLRILSGMYGVLRPYDLIKPHRLDMGTGIKKLKIKKHTNLYSFWGSSLADQLNQSLDLMSEKDKVVVNLSTDEHVKALNLDELNAEFIDIKFLQVKDSVERNVMLYSKQARGLFIRFAVENQLGSKDCLKEFNLGGYRFSRQEGDTLIFVR